MNVTRRTNRMGLLALLLCTLPIAAHAERPAHGRVSYDADGTFLLGNDDADWVHATLNSLVLPGDSIWVDEENLSEIELASGTYLRMSNQANVEIVTLEPDIRLRGLTGSFYIHRLRESTGDFIFESPAADVIVPPNNLIRVDIETNGGTTIYVLDGNVTITIGPEHQQSLGSGLQVYIEPGHLASEILRFDGLNDDFDAWNRDRVAYVATGYTSGGKPPQFDRPPLGGSELASNGRWIDYQGRNFWQPDPALSYVPYRDGYWTNVARCGDVWVGRYGFEYTTTHYGRWSYVEQHGWLWHYESQWSPAWVAAVKYGPSLVWSPLGLDNRPVQYSTGATFKVGNLTFSLGASTLVPVERVYSGYRFVEPARIELLPRVEQTNIQIWNIDVNNIVINTYRSDLATYALFSGKSSHAVRGLFTVGNSKRAPRDVVGALRKSVGKMGDFKAHGKKALAGPSTRPAGKEFRKVHLKDSAKVAKTQAGPGRGQAKIAPNTSVRLDVDRTNGRAEKSGGPEMKGKGGPSEKGNKGGGAEAKGKGNGGPSEKSNKGGGAEAKGKGNGGPSEKGNKGGGPKSDKGQGKGKK